MFFDRTGNRDECDVVIVSGDAFVDHPAFGTAVVGRVLEAAGFRVGIIAQPRWSSLDDIKRLGRPRLFFGVTAGNVDSLLANLSPNGQRRRRDEYSAGGRPGMRPDRAVIVYCNLLRQAFGDVPLVIGGIEASLRRLAHYDYRADAVRRSILVDSRADILVYGMGEKQVVEIARRLDRNEALDGIAGTCVVLNDVPGNSVRLPAFEEVSTSPDSFNLAFRLWHREHANPQGLTVVQPHGNRFVVQFPVPQPLSQAEFDAIYDLPFKRQAHPVYREPVPALEPVRFSITSHRGCFGACTFCSLSAHQGRIIQWRSEESVVREVKRVAALPEFKGHITDIGGPTANMYAASCPQMRQGRVCPERECVWPKKCPSLELHLEQHSRLLEAAARVPGVKKVTVGTGIRFDLLDDSYLGRLCASHVSGQLRVAPEHVAAGTLNAMRKFPPGLWLDFRRRFRATVRQRKPPLYLVPYFISGHPGSTLDDAVELAEHIVKVERFRIEKVQQFTPLPMTQASAMWHTGRDPLTGQPVYVARSEEEQRCQRALLQLYEPRNFSLALRLLGKLGRPDLARRVRALRPLLTRPRRPE